MNLVRRAAIASILTTHAEQAADEIERILFERDPDWTRRHPSPAPQNPPASFAQLAAEEHLRALADEGRNPAEIARDYLAQPDAFEEALRIHQERNASDAGNNASNSPDIGHQRQEDPPKPNPDNVWGAVHKLRARFGDEAAQILVDALSQEMQGRMDAAAQRVCEEVEREKQQRDQARDRITARVLRDHSKTLDLLSDDAQPAPYTPLFLPTIKELSDKADRLKVEHDLAVMQRVLTDDILDVVMAISKDRQICAENLREIADKLRNVNISFDNLTPKSDREPAR